MVKRRKKSNNHHHIVGSWAYIVGLVVAALLGFGLSGAYQNIFLWIIFVLGVAVGLLNVKIEEVNGFLAAGTALVVVSFFGLAGGVFTLVAPAIANMLMGVLTMFVPATIIVALRAVFVHARN